MSKQRKTIGQHDELINKIRALEGEKDVLQGEADALRKNHTHAARAVEDRRHEAELIEEQLKSQKTQLQQARRDFTEQTKKMTERLTADHSGSVSAADHSGSVSAVGRLWEHTNREDAATGSSAPYPSAGPLGKGK